MRAAHQPAQVIGEGVLVLGLAATGDSQYLLHRLPGGPIHDGLVASFSAPLTGCVHGAGSARLARDASIGANSGPSGGFPNILDIFAASH